MREVTRLIGASLFLLLVVAVTPVVAQTQTICTASPCPLQQSKAFQAAADHDGVDTTEYRLYINGTVAQTLPVASLTTGVITFNVPGLLKGTYVLYLEALGEGGATGSVQLTAVVTPGKPKAPLNFRIISASATP